MYKDKYIAVVIPAYNEELLIARTITTVPDFLDKIVVINDASKDKTSEILHSLHLDQSDRLVIIEHSVNQGVGGAIASGYKWCRDNDIDVAVVMAGDGQMDPNDLSALLDPVVNDQVDYTKGNRLFTGDAWKIIPKTRFLGNSGLSMMTKIASGYWHVADSQCGYTAINKKALHLINWDQMYKRYGQPNDLLVRLNVYDLRVVDVPVRPVYNIGEKSGINPIRVIPKFAILLVKLFSWRMKEKYIIRDFHPLIFFYLLGTILLILDIPLLVRLFTLWIQSSNVPPMTALTIFFFTISALQLLLFAMWFDMEANRHLNPN